MTFTVRFHFKLGNFLICVDAPTDVQALAKAKRELSTALGSEGALKRTTRIEIFKGALAGLQPGNA